jgi:hypothetical protein
MRPPDVVLPAIPARRKNPRAEKQQAYCPQQQKAYDPGEYLAFK